MITLIELLRNRGVLSAVVAVVATLANIFGLGDVIPNQEALVEGLLATVAALAAVFAAFSVRPGDEQK